MTNLQTKGSARTEGGALAPAPWGRFGRCPAVPGVGERLDG